MKQLAEFIPIALFFIVYQLDGEELRLGEWSYTVDGIFSATAVLIIATALQAGVSFALTRQIAQKGGAVTYDVPIQTSGLIPQPFIEQLRVIGQAMK